MLDLLKKLVDFIMHIDVHLVDLVTRFGVGAYAIVALIILCETGLVVTPFLPGDSLLFAAGALSAKGAFNVYVLFPLLFIAAVIGDNMNYWIGRKFGRQAFDGKSRFFKPAYLERTEKFFARHGKPAIVMARFAPILRTFMPFVAGIGQMRYGTYLRYSIFGGFLWTGLFIWGGYFFGNIPWVKEHFGIVIVVIVIVSLIPSAVAALAHRKGGNNS